MTTKEMTAGAIVLASLQGRPAVRRVTMFVAPNTTVKATRQHPKPGTAETILVTMGRPNYRERQIIKAAQRAGQTFPLQAMREDPWPRRRSA